MPNNWINHVKDFARENNLTYGCAISNPLCKSSYKKPVKQKAEQPAPATAPETKTFRKKRPAPSPVPPPPPIFVPPPPPQTLASFTEPNITKQEYDLLQETKKIFRDFTRGIRTGNSNIDYMNESIAREYAQKIQADYVKRQANDLKNMKVGGAEPETKTFRKKRAPPPPKILLIKDAPPKKVRRTWAEGYEQKAMAKNDIKRPPMQRITKAYSKMIKKAVGTGHLSKKELNSLGLD